MKPTRVRTLNCSLFIINMNVWCFRKTLTLWWLLHRQCFIARKIFFGGAMSPNHSQAGFLWLIGAPATRINNGGHCASHKTSRVFKYSVIGLCPRLRSLLGVDAALDRAVLENGTRHSTTWWRVYMQLSNDCPSGADDRINFVLCSYFFLYIHYNMVVCTDVLRSRFNFECTVMNKSSAELMKPPLY